MITSMGGWWRRFTGWLERAAGRFDSLPGDRLFVNALPPLGVSGSRISRDAAVRVPAVLRGRNMITSVATLPFVQRDPALNIVPSSLLLQFDRDIPNIVHLSQTVEDLLFEGVAWWRIVGRDFAGYPTEVQRLEPSSVSLDPPAGRSPAPVPAGYDPRGGVVYVDGEPVAGTTVIRFDSPNPGICTAGAGAIRRAILLDAAAKAYAEDPRPLDYFSPAEGADELDDDEAAGIIATWQAARRKRATGWVPRALQYNVVQSPTPADLQLVQLQERAALEIANLMGVDPEDLGVSTTSRTYANNVDRRRDRVNDVLMPYIRALTDRLSMGDVTRRGYTVWVDLDDYLRANPTERWGVYEKALNLGVIDVEEVRREEGWAAGAPGPAATPTVPNDASALNADGSLRRFDGPARFTADLPLRTFSVDAATRTVEGVALPFSETARKGRARFRFAAGSLSWSEPGRVKLLRDHDYGQPLGRAVALSATDEALTVRFSVARGAAGDEALALAEDGVLDGLSVGVDYGDDDVSVLDDGTVLISRADLLEVSMTAMPAFDSARVTRVAASRNGGSMEDCATCGQRHAPNVACPPTVPPAGPAATYTADQVAALMNSRPSAVPAPVPDSGPSVVNPTRPGGATFVREPEPYRFDRRGNLQRGSHDFSSDLRAAHLLGDQGAYDRALAFVQQQFDVVTTDVNELNPTRNRQDMYVDQRDYRYPVWDAINKGTLGDITPFTFPKFSSASGLVGNHTEGSEPSSGTLVTTSQTVTPTAVSGKAKVSRETWDQGGNPQISNLIWRQMLKGWYEALEAAAVAVLDAATPTALATFTAGGGTGKRTLVAELTAGLAALQFVRGGYAFDQAFAQVDLYKDLIAAEDADGRKLFPALGPSNATGDVSRYFGQIDVNGTVFNPAWALAATGSVAASSYIFDSETVHGWASTPQRLFFEYEVANLYVGIWGYKATAISDITGVREITYDPVA